MLTEAEHKVVASLMDIEDVKRQLGFPPCDPKDAKKEQQTYQQNIALLLASQGFEGGLDIPASALTLVRNYREKTRLLEKTTSAPVVNRIQGFINKHLADTGIIPKVPCNTLVLAEHGLSRELCFPIGKNEFKSEMQSSYRVAQGVLHNPKNDKRTTKGSFHIAEGGFPISSDKIAVPKAVFAKMLEAAFNPPDDMSLLPYTAETKRPAHVMASLLLRPLVAPAVPGHMETKTMEVYCLAPGTLVSCLDFLESIFGNAGDPYLPQNDAGLDSDHWTGHTGMLVMAPHICKMTKKELGLPNVADATPLQKKQGMCWTDPEEKYNDGKAFKLTCCTEDGVMLTIIADNYFGYCKKEVKTMISYACNLMGLSEEEHSGGTLAFPRYSYGFVYNADAESKRWAHLAGYTFSEAMQILGDDYVEIHPEGYAVDKNFPSIVYVPETSFFDLRSNSITYVNERGVSKTIKLQPDRIYILPSGFQLQAMHHPAAPAWRLIGTEGRGVFIHKPCTVSGGGKSELSKAIDTSMIYGPMYVNDPEKDFAMVDEILKKDFSKRFKDASRVDSRSLLDDKRSIGSVIKLLTPDDEAYTAEYNEWLRSFPEHIFPIVYYVKRFNRDGVDDWKKHFSMDLVNGTHGHELKLDDRRIQAGFLRVGLSKNGSFWRTYKTRVDYVPCSKVQMEDDISVSITVPTEWIPEGNPPVRVATPVFRDSRPPSALAEEEEAAKAEDEATRAIASKLAVNCEFRLFQRPDDCVVPGADEQCESDLSEPGNFIANFEAYHADKAREVTEDVMGFESFSKPMRTFIKNFSEEAEDDEFFVLSSNTRLVNGKPSANPRYLQNRPDAVLAEKTYISQIARHLADRIPTNMPLVETVKVILLGRCISKPAAQLPNLTCFNPIHFQDLPELLMDLCCCMSGKSPSTSGAGSEGALTKGPFNALPFSADLNNLLVSYILTGLGGWSTPTGYVGPCYRFAHDMSFLSPEVFSRMKPFERDPEWLKKNGYLERVEDFEHNGKKVLASRLGWRITKKFQNFFARVFEYPNIFSDDILRPETQSKDSFAEAVDSIVTAQKVIAQLYFDDGTVNHLCPPLKALLHIMLNGNYEGKDLSSPEIRDMFTRENLLKSDWYRQRLVNQQKRDIALWSRHVAALEAYIAAPGNEEPVYNLDLKARLATAKKKLEEVSSSAYVDSLVGTIGADPIIGTD